MELTRDEFRSALSKGSGQAMRLVLASPEGLSDILEDACLRNLTYDPQCEADRSEYLARLIAAIGREAEFFGSLSGRLDSDTADASESDVGQTFAVLRRLAEPHDSLAASRLQRVFEQMSPEHQLECMDDMVRLFGLPALVEFAERLVDDLEEEGWRGALLLDAFRERDSSGADEALQKAKGASEALSRLLAYVAALEEVVPPTPPDLPRIRARLKRGEPAGGVRPMALSDAEWSAIGADFSAEHDPKRALPYLRLFARRPFSGEVGAILPWLKSENSRVTWAAVVAVGRLHDPQVRDLALQRIAVGDASGVRLLRANYEPGDMAKVAPLLDAADDDHLVHELGCAILDLVKEQNLPAHECRDILLRLYERTPCSLCRHEAVASLDARSEIPKWMADECVFDADPATAELAERLGRRVTP